MSESVRHIIRQVYSEVLYELAEEAGQVDRVMDDLTRVESVLKEQPDFAALLNTRKIDGREKSDIINRVFAGRVAGLTIDFLHILAKRNRIGLLSGIHGKYESIVDVHSQRSLVEVTFAKMPNEERLEKLKDQLTRAMKKQVRLSVQIDPDMIGGIVIRKGDRLIDNSVRSILKRAVKTVMERSKERIESKKREQ